jgi:pimeloyl-ACP methyl ester carboxylesterase
MARQAPEGLLGIHVSFAQMVPPGVHAPRTWTEQAYHNLIYLNEAEKGGHFAAWEQPLVFSEELRAAFRTLR